MSGSVFWRIAVIVAFMGAGGASMAQIPPAGIAARLAQDNVQDGAVRQFYQARQFAPAWSGSAAGDANARQLLASIARSGEEGLDPGHYVLSGIDDEAARDIAITALAFRYMRDMADGRSDLKNLDPDVALPPKSFDAAAALEEALRQNRLGAMLAGLSPPEPQYLHLKAALVFYRQIAAQGGWPIVPGAEPDQDTVALLWRRLAYEDGALMGTPQSAVLEAAIRRFQARHGLVADGVAGRKTLAALNVPAAMRADTIAANLERWRWLPRVPEVDRIMVNVADAELEMWLGGKPILTSRVVVGRPHDPTPILRAEGAGLTVNPPWKIPASIAAREILPKLKANPAYLASQDMVLVNGPPGDPQGLHVNWRAVRAGTFPYQIRQFPGPRNPLGRIKLELPNKFDVYLHDTPGKSAFARPVRALSHGCVRVEQILPLASYALDADLKAQDIIVRAIGTGETKYLPLHKKLPVYFLYWTAFADAQGEMNFRPDIYGRDQRLIEALRSRPLQLATAIAGCPKRADLPTAGKAPT